MPMEKDRRLELIDLAIQKLINNDDDQLKHDNNNNLKDHDAQYQLALSHLLSASQLEIMKKDETVNQSKASSPSSDSVNKKTESENCEGGSKSSENDETIIKELKKVKRQNFVTHCLLSVMIVLTMAWQLSEVSLILRVKEGINHPFKSFGNMIKGVVTDINGNGNGNGHEADHNKNKQNGNGSSSLSSFKIPEMPHTNLPNLAKE